MAAQVHDVIAPKLLLAPALERAPLVVGIDRVEEAKQGPLHPGPERS
jgi:hypothetical protein